MNNLLNKIFGVSRRATGNIDDDGKVTITKIISYDIMPNPGFSGATFDISQIREMERQMLLKTRKEKLKKLDNLGF